MNDYDFTKLNDKEFEALTIDLIAKVEGRRIERFKPGKDAGVDGRFFASNNSEVVIQCKHWHKSGLQALLRSLKKTEADKVDKLKPARYLLATSVELSRQNKKTITNIFAPHIKSESDILGKEDLNDLLSEHKDIEEKHYKLWLSSTNVLKIILNAAVIGRSSFKVDEINEFSSKYVRTSEHDRALQMLESLRSIIITGEPGVGKTTLADNLCLSYIIEGYELCFIEESISEAEDLFNKEKKQLFYFDDFLGRNYLLALGRHEDSHVINFIKRVGKAKNKRFILTSRTTVLNQGKRLSDMFKIENIDRNEYELNIKELSNIEKAKILYNHIWFSDLDPIFIDELYIDKRYKEIIKHENYNPRLISFITDAHKVADIDPGAYWKYIESTLDNPADTWGHVYDNQLDDHSRLLVCLVAFNGRSIVEDDLKAAFISYSTDDNSQVGISDFYRGIKLAVGAVLNREITSGSDLVTYDLFSPALGDYLLSRYFEDEQMLFKIFCSLQTYDSLQNMQSLHNTNVIDTKIIRNILSRLLSYHIDDTENFNSSYIIKLIHLVMLNIDLTDTSRDQLMFWITRLDMDLIDSSSAGFIFNIVMNLIHFDVATEEELPIDDLFENLLTNDLESDDYSSIGQLLALLSSGFRDRYSQKFKKIVVEYWQDQIDNDVTNSGTLEEFFYDDDMDAAYDALRKHVELTLSEYALDLEDDDVDSVCEFCDIWGHIESNRENSAMTDEYREHGTTPDYSSVSEDVAIDNLFERS